MQDLLVELLWRDPAIHAAVFQFLNTIPGYHRALEEYQAVEAQIRDAVDPALLEDFQSRLLDCTSYEVQAYYGIGLQLRQELARAISL